MSSISKTRHSNGTRHATMIQGNRDVSIGNNATLNLHVDEATLERRDRALDLLRSNSSLAALLNSNERFDPPRCADATRRAIIQKTEDWIRHDSVDSPPSSVFWLYGAAGAGKSALAQTLAEKFESKGGLAASFFFFRSDRKRNNGNRLIPTLALQLVYSFQGIGSLLEDTILAKPHLLTMSRESQMLELLVKPLIELWNQELDAQAPTPSHPHPRLIVIDGLDECSDREAQCDLLQIIASAIPHLPYPLRFLITSRPESHIVRVFNHELEKTARYNLSEDFEAGNDIRSFVEAQFAQIRRSHPLGEHLPAHWPPYGSVGSIVERSSSHFIYAATVIRFIQSPRHRPDDRLDVILGLKQPFQQDRPYAALDLLYRLIFLEIEDSNQLETIQRALGIVYLRSRRVGLFAWRQWVSDRGVIEILLEMRPGDLVLLFDPLLSLVAIENDNMRIFHKSLFDYLLDPSRSEDLQLDLGLAHETAANYLSSERVKLDDRAILQDLAFHCHFAHLNETLRTRLLSLTNDPETTFANSLHEPEVLKLILFFLHVLGRQEFDSSGKCYRKCVEKQVRWFRSVVPWSRQMKSMIAELMRFEVTRMSADIKGNLRLAFRRLYRERFGLKGIQLGDMKRFNSAVPSPTVNTSIIESIKREHEMFSSYVKARYSYPCIVFSILDSSADLVHSCHFVICTGATTEVRFVLLATYSQHGIRLLCTQLGTRPHFAVKGHAALDVYTWVKRHFQSIQDRIKKANDPSITMCMGCYLR